MYQDRFGQMQRAILTNILIKDYYNKLPVSHTTTTDCVASLSVYDILNQLTSEQTQALDGLLLRSFRWFGSYLLWYPVDNEGVYIAPTDNRHSQAAVSRVFVEHINGRRGYTGKHVGAVGTYSGNGSHNSDPSDASPGCITGTSSSNDEDFIGHIYDGEEYKEDSDMVEAIM